MKMYLYKMKLKNHKKTFL